MNCEEVESLVGILREYPGLTELEVRSGSRALRLRRAPHSVSRMGAATSSVGTSGDSVFTAASAGPAAISSIGGLPQQSEGAFESVSSASLNASAVIRQIESSLAAIATTRVTADIVGVFRAHRKADLSIGSQVTESESLGQIEAMRLLNDCPSPISGRITAILVQDGEPVEYGQPLFELAELEPAS